LLGQGDSGHDLGRDLREGLADGLGNERHGARGAGVHLQHKNRSALDRELRIHEPNDVEALGHLRNLLA
jgi:hypothetical protein